MIMITVSDFDLSCIDLELGMSCDNNSTVLGTNIALSPSWDWAETKVGGWGRHGTDFPLFLGSVPASIHGFVNMYMYTGNNSPELLL